MLFRKLGNSSLDVSLLGYGAWALGGDGWDDVDIQEALKVLEKSYESGINFYDTAPIYGKGKSEERIGEVFKGVRDKVIIATKCGLLWNDSGKVWIDVSRDAIMKDIEMSLKRLKTDYIDLYQIHWLDGKTSLKESFETLNELKKQGIIKNIGVCNFNRNQLIEGLSYSEIISVQNQYNILQNESEKEIFPLCLEKDIGFIAYSPLAQGLLSGKITKDYKIKKGDSREFNPLFKKNKFADALKFVEDMKEPKVKTAMDYIFDRKEVSTIIVSMTKMKHLEENIKIINEK